MQLLTLKPFTLKLCTILLFAFITGSAYTADPANEDVVETRSKGTKIQLIEGATPVYPESARSRGIEGWVTLKYVVKADGTTDEIEIVDSSIEGYFDNAAIKAVEKRVYQPATLKGKPVMQGNVGLLSVFQLRESEGGVSKQFLSLYKDASTALDDGNLEQANSLIEELEGKQKRRLAEVCYLDMLKARYFEGMGDKAETLRYVERALVIADNVATKPIYINLLQQAIVDNAKARNLQASLKHYQTLIAVDDKMAPDDPIHNYVSRINQVLAGGGNINFEGTIYPSCKECERSDGFWHHELNRNRFSIDQVVGELSEIGIVCENSSVTVVYKEQMAWSVNRDAGMCSIRVHGESGTTFRLVELPNET